MAKVEQTIDVNVPVTTAYNQWTQFEEFPRFMQAVKEVRQLDDRTLEWTAEIKGKEHTWLAEITEQEPDMRVAWRSKDQPHNAGVVTFHRLDAGTTRVMLQMEWQPTDATEKLGEVLGFDDRQVKADLERFKEFIESRGQATGAWRGEIKQGSAR